VLPVSERNDTNDERQQPHCERYPSHRTRQPQQKLESDCSEGQGQGPSLGIRERVNSRSSLTSATSSLACESCPGPQRQKAERHDVEHEFRSGIHGVVPKAHDPKIVLCATSWYSSYTRAAPAKSTMPPDNAPTMPRPMAPSARSAPLAPKAETPAANDSAEPANATPTPIPFVIAPPFPPPEQAHSPVGSVRLIGSSPA
jgi:hypothetical protein